MLNISFEFFPPKTNDGIEKLKQTTLQLAHYQPNYFSVTFGAGGSQQSGTMKIVNVLKKITAIDVAPHITCVGLDRDELANIFVAYQAMGVQHLVVLRGDNIDHTGAFRYASELIAFIRAVTGNHFHIKVAAYPECHPQAKNFREDILNLKRKWEAGANSAVTQYFFNADAYFYFLDACAKENIFMPIVPGIMPITQLESLVRFSKLCGAEMPAWLLKRLEMYRDDKPSLQAFGLEVVHQLCERLINGGAPGLHFYTLNHAAESAKILQALGRYFYPEDATKVSPPAS